jgi:hypothetical protein
MQHLRFGRTPFHGTRADSSRPTNSTRGVILEILEILIKKALERGWGEASSSAAPSVLALKLTLPMHAAKKNLQKYQPQTRQPEAEMQHQRFGGTPTPPFSILHSPFSIPNPQLKTPNCFHQYFANLHPKLLIVNYSVLIIFAFNILIDIS